MSEQTLLLVDDNPTNLQVLYQTLENCGYRLLIARSGQAALEVVRESRPDLVLLDIMMPEMDGFEVCEKLKADPDTKDTAVIFLSALNDTESTVKGLAMGGVDYVSKPFQAEEIVARVSTHLRLRRLERALARRNDELEAELARIMAVMQEGIYSLDRSGGISFANKAAEGITGFEQADLIGRSIYDVHGLDIDALPQETTQQLFQLELLNKSASKFSVSGSLTPILEGDEVTGYAMVFLDISQQLKDEQDLKDAKEELLKQRRRLAHLERLSTMGEMAAGFAHEVNQPLTAISNYASVGRRLLDKQPLEKEKLQTTLEKMQNQAVRASEVIERLRNFVRTPKEGKVVKSPIALAREVIELAEVDSGNTGVNIALEIPQEVSGVLIDNIQIQQVALNLLRNAMEAMSNTDEASLGVKLRIEQAGEKVRFSVIDKGRGLADDAEEHLFHPFYSTKPNGMGIGLSVCASIIQDHGGLIDYKRNDGKGTTFYFELAAYS